mgnify:CR=1 FL=1
MRITRSGLGKGPHSNGKLLCWHGKVCGSEEALREGCACQLIFIDSSSPVRYEGDGGETDQGCAAFCPTSHLDGCEGVREQFYRLPVWQFAEGAGNAGERDPRSPYRVLGGRCAPLRRRLSEDAHVILLRHLLLLPPPHPHLPHLRPSPLEPRRSLSPLCQR